MKKFVSTSLRYYVITMVLIIGTTAFAQSDSALNRSVTVERDFQPVIQAAGKISTRPAVVETTIEPAPVEYSTYTADVTPEAAIQPMLSQPTRFEPGKRYNGYVRGGLGHPNTLFDFGYHLDDGKNSILDVYAHHKAEWGLATLSKTLLGLNFKHTYSTCDLYFGVNGSNIFYHKYGHFYDYSQDHGLWAKNSTAYPKPHSFGKMDNTALWTTEVFLGVKSNPKQDVQYMVQTGYKLFSKPGAVSEHQIRTHGSFNWHREEHHVGAVVYVQNNFLQLGSLGDVIPDSMYRSRHNFRIEPYYAYEGKRVRVHVGVNFDLNIGHGKNSLSGTENVSFAPSPHIFLEAQVAKQWLTIYADIEGHHGLGSLQEYMEENRYRLIHAGIVEPHSASYTPVDAEIGFHIRPHRDLLIELHGGYAYMTHEDVWVATADSANYALLNLPVKPGDFLYLHTDYQRGKIGGQLNYHYRDIVRVHFHGDAYFWKGDTTVYDRAKWEMGLRIDGRIDKHWSLYSDNHFEGSRKALASDGEHTLAPRVNLNLGLQYDMWVGKVKDEKLKVKGNGEQILRPETKPNLTLFFQLNNWLHRKNEIYYGYREQGINFLMGATFRF